MNGEIPSVPITTLAGIASLTDLLREMPLPSPLPQTLSNKSLLFHPRVAEEAQILLSVRDDALVPQLIQSLVLTSADHIELKDHYAGTEPPLDQQQNIPLLLKAILQRNPNVFKGPRANSPRQPAWNLNQVGSGLGNSNHNQSSPASYGQVSPSYSSPCGSRHTPQGSPTRPPPRTHPPPLEALQPPPPLQPLRPSVITDSLVKQNGNDLSGTFFNAKQHSVGVGHLGQLDSVDQAYVGSDLVKEERLSQDSGLGSSLRSSGDVLSNQLTAPTFVPPLKPHSTAVPQPAMTAAATAPLVAASIFPAASVEKEQKPATLAAETRLPIVRLDRLSAEDQALMQKSLKAFAAKSPSLASQLGITYNHNRASAGSGSESEGDERSQRNKSKYFKAREKERDEQRLKQKEDRKRNVDDEEYFPSNSGDGLGSSLTDRIKKRKRSFANHRPEDGEENCVSPEESHAAPVRPKLRKVERKFLPVLEKLSTEDLMETNTYQRFTRSIEMVFENTEDVDLTAADLDDDADVPAEAMISKYQLQDLCSEAAKLKVLGAMDAVPSDRLVRLLNILEKNIRDGTRVSPLADPDDDEDESKMWLELTMERVMRAVDASLTAVYIMTSPNMPKRIYLEDVIDRIVQFTKYQLQNTIYPSFDPVYRIDSKNNYTGNARKKRAHVKEVREKSILLLYNKLHQLVSLLAELLNIQILTDTAVLHASSMGVAPFFVENVSQLQLSALKLVTTIFTKYEKHRRLLLDDILASIARLPSSKRSLRSYRLSSEENIQMLTALVLQLIQCVVVLPDSLCPVFKSRKSETAQDTDKQANANVDRDVLIVSKYETATRTAANFLTVFLNKCGSKSDDIDYRPLFENFVQDLLTTVNKPEWPATELLLSLLGKLLVTNFGNKGIEMSLRVVSLDNLGLIAARLRKDAVTSQGKLNTIDQIIRDVKAEELKDGEDINRRRTGKVKSDAKSVDEGCEPGDEEERTQFLQRVLLDYLAVNSVDNTAHTYARHFYLAQWYRDATVDRGPTISPAKHTSRKHKKHNKKKSRKDESSDDASSDISDVDEEDVSLQSEVKNAQLVKLNEQRKAFLVTKIKPVQEGKSHTTHTLQTYIDYESAELISRFLASKRAFSCSFDNYLKQMLCVLTETSIQIRTKALKCLTMVVEADPSVLARHDMQTGVRHSFLDHSTSVREAAVDLVGKFVLSRPELINKYYEMLSLRILDTGVSVRKRVIKILKDICIECPDFPKIPEICVKMIRRVNDEEGIRKLVMEVFQNMWFSPVREKPFDAGGLLRKVMNITDVVAASKEMGLEWFEQLLLSLFKPKEDKDDSTKVHVEPPKALLTACKQIVDCLIENVLRLEETSYNADVGGAGSGGSSQRLVACLTTLYLFAKIRPKLLVNHAITLQPYLSLKCQTQGDYQIISSVARTLELVVPLMEHPSETFLAQLEEDSVKLIFQHDQTVVASCLSCLGSVVNNVTRNFKLIRDCFNKYYGQLTNYKNLYVQNPADPQILKYRPLFRRAMFTVGLLLRHFDFTDKDVIVGLPDGIKDEVFETLSYFVHEENADIQTYTLKAIGSLCIRHYEFMLGPGLKTLYHRLLTAEDAPLQMRSQVLNNIEMYLQEEERRMIKQDQEWAKLSKGENLKEMGDVSSGMASTVIQLYLKEILDAFLHPNVGVRQAALKVIQLILAQGLVHIVQIVPYLICMSTDSEQMISHSADKQLQDIEKKYPGFIHMKSQSGIRLAYKLQLILQPEGTGVARGYRSRKGEPPGALNGFLYSILRSTKQQRRALTLSILKQFDEQVKTSLSQMLYLADNLAYFPYQVQDEPLFIIHHIDIMISVSGTNVLQAFKEALIPVPGSEVTEQLLPTGSSGPGDPAPGAYLEEDEDDDEAILLSRVPEDTAVLQDCITASQGCLLLLVLKQHLKDLYGISDAKISQYSPSETAKVYEKAVSRKSNSKFDPKATVQKIITAAPNAHLDEEARKALIEQYLDFKQLMMKYEPEDGADEDERDGAAKPAVVKKSAEEEVASNAAPPPPGTLLPSPEHKDPPQRIPKVTIVPPKPPEVKDSKHHRPHKTHKSERHRKHRHKKKRKKFGSDEDSDPEFSDPDFLV